MGKKAKKKVQAIVVKVDRGSSPSGGFMSQSSPFVADNGGGGEEGCVHAANIQKLQIQIEKSAVLQCLDCCKLRTGVSVGKERRAKGKVMRKKHLSLTNPVEEKDGVQRLWVCLSCGHTGCGGRNSNGGGEVSNKDEAKQGIVGRGHAWQHWLQLKHPMVMLIGDQFPYWCFKCGVDRSGGFVTGYRNVLDDEAETKLSASSPRSLLLQESAKLIREKLDQWVKAKNVSVEPKDSEEAGLSCALMEYANIVEEERIANANRRVMKGLVNLGNTCFFNSVMQILLSVDLLRSHFLHESSGHEGALTSSLRKFFQEASAQSQPDSNASSGNGTGGKKNGNASGGRSDMCETYNPRGLFGAICSKVSRFKGFQQQDSHEFLRCLLDGLHTEEIAVKASSKWKTAGGESALRALSTTDALEDGDKSLSGKREDSGSSLPDYERTEGSGDSLAEDAGQKIEAPTETLVQRVFGGQLSSTVTCCECGHYSVVQESVLDLSLPIPSKKSSKAAPALRENGRSTKLGTSEGVQPLKIFNANDKGTDVSRSVHSGLETPLLVRPWSPYKGQNGDCENAGAPSSGVWLDCMSPGTGSDDTGWLDFLGGDRDAEPPTTFDCSPNLESLTVSGCSPSPPNPESFTVFGCSLDPESLMISGCSRNPESPIVSDCPPSSGSRIIFCCAASRALMQQSSGISTALDENDTRQTRLIPVDNSCQRLVEFKQCGELKGEDISLVANRTAANKILFKLLEAVPESVGETNYSGFCEFEESDSWLIRGEDADFQVQMRGGSEDQSGLTQEAELDHYPVSDQLIDTITGIEQSEDDVTRPRRDIVSDSISGGVVILLEPPPEKGLSLTCSNLDLECDYEGVGTMFEGGDNEDRLCGPFASSCDDAVFEGSGTYDEFSLDEIDMTKIRSAGGGRSLVSHQDRQGDENDGPSMSLEECLEVFTKSELLSGENAWGCENCTRKYHEELEKLSTKPSVVPVHLNELEGTLSESRIGYSDSGGKNDVLVTRAPKIFQENKGKLDNTLLEHIVHRGVEDAGVEITIFTDDYNNAGNARSGGMVGGNSGSVNLEMCPLCGLAIVEIRRLAPCDLGAIGNIRSPGQCVCLLDVSKGRPHENGRDSETRQQKQCDGNESVVNLAGLVDCKCMYGDLQYKKQGELLSDGRIENFDAKGGDESNNCNLGSDMSGEPERKVGPGSFGKTPNLLKSKSRKVPGQRKTLIKQDATKRFLISRPPRVLTIQLKRFAQDMRGRLNKLSGHIAFQERFDLRPYLDHRHVNFGCNYRLIGTVEHSGTLKSGHYVAFVRGPPTPSATGLKCDSMDNLGGVSSWYYISDSHVRQTTLDSVLQSEAYLVFYERVDTGGVFNKSDV